MRRSVEIEPVLTDAFNRIVLAMEKAITERKIICIVSPSGIGFKFAAKRFAMKHYLKIIYSNVEASGSIQEVFCSIDNKLSNIGFSNIDRRNCSLHQLTLKINERVQSNDCCLLIVDNCNLTPGQLRYFIRFLNNFNKKIGLVFRMSTTYHHKLKKWKKWEGLYTKLYKVVDGWKGLDELTEDELIDICKSNGVKDEMIISDLIKVSNGDLSVMKKDMSRYFELKAKDEYESQKS